jgi:hypothetical protein
VALAEVQETRVRQPQASQRAQELRASQAEAERAQKPVQGQKQELRVC